MKGPRRRLRLVLGIAWAAGFIATFVAWRQSGVPVEELPESFANWLEDFGPGNAVALFLSLYTVRPLVFFPSSLFSIAAGLLFGPWIGFLLTVLGENLGANLAFSLSRFLGRNWIAASERRFFQRLDEQFHLHGFRLVLIFRLIYLPFDTVSYGCGLTSIRRSEFALATFIGALPSLLTLALLGGAASARLDETILLLGYPIRQRILVLSLSAVTFLIGVGLAIHLRRRYRAFAAGISKD